MKRFKKDWIVLFLVATICLFFGISLIVWPSFKSKGIEIVNYIVGVLLIIYIGAFLVPHITRKRRTVVKAFMIVELVFVTLMALSMFFPSIPISVTIAQALGVCLYARGFVEIVRGYYNLGDIRVAGKESPYDRAAKYINILLITLGTWVFFCGSRYINQENVILVIAVSLIVASLVCLVFGIIHLNDERKHAPKKVKEKKKEKEETKQIEEEKEETNTKNPKK